MAAQRIVVTSPWKLGLFVFLLVVGTGFGIIYAWLRLFGGALEFADAAWMKNFYFVAGGVAGLGLIGYLSIVANARPMDGVMRGGKQRERVLKAFGQIKDPNEVDTQDFGVVPPLAKALERWQQDSGTATEAQLELRSQREAIDQLAARVAKLSADEELMARENDDQLSHLVDAINSFASQKRDNSDQPVAPANGSADLAAWQQSSLEFRQHQAKLLGLAQSMRQSSESLAQRADAAASPGDNGASPVGQMSSQSVERLRELRQKLEGLAEESSRLAIQAALQVSRLGESGGELVEVTEDIRSVSTRYQQLVPDLRLCENDAEAILGSLGAGSGSGGSDPRTATFLNESASVIQAVAEAMASTLEQLSNAFGQPQPSAPVEIPVADAAPAPLSAPTPVVEQAAPAAISEAVAPVAAAFEEDIVDLADLGGQEVVAEEVSEIADLGGHELDADGQPIYDLMEFGAAEV